MAADYPSNAVLVENIRKTFPIVAYRRGIRGAVASLLRPSSRTVNALGGVSFTVGTGEIVGLMGGSGAGKSTLLKLLTGIMYPTSGTACVLGVIPWAARKKLAFQIGVVFGQKSNLWYHLPPLDTFWLHASIYDIQRKAAKKRIDELIERFHLSAFVTTPVRKLSLGQRMLCELVSNLLHRPRIIFLDEPAIGLDILAKQTLRRYILEVNATDGTTVIITSHDVMDIEYLSTRVLILNGGYIVQDTSINDLRRNYLKKKIVEIHAFDPVAVPAMQGVDVIERTEHMVKVCVNTERQNIHAVLSKIVASGNVIDISIVDPPLEDIIASIYRSTAV